MYGSFASVYDRLMADVDYDAWSAFYREMLASSGVQDGGTVLETACGTGSMTVRLAKHYSLLPGDLSQEMLSRAVLKAREHGLTLPFLRQDMRQLRSHRPVDAVVAACDGVNYLLKKEDLRRFLRSAFRVLRPGGALLFDVSSAFKLREVLGNTPRMLREEDVCYFWENRWNERARRLFMCLSIFLKRPDGAWELIQEEQAQRAWDEDELVQALKEEGFESIRRYGARSLTPPKRGEERLHFAANKPKDGNT